ncbi:MULTISPECIES: ROK family protein [Sphingobacterium]|uniref:ROK family protein n=1 Tax=Sphingobacterium TaxID=28453 RepID=UPI0013D90944|nr:MULTISPECIES: ROK family protein [unclassified Sphingobacterium]
MSQSKSTYILACDIGGTHITSAIVACDTWSILSETITRAEVNSSKNAKSIFQSWTNAIKESIARFNGPIDQIGIAMPGPFDYENGISLMNGQNKYDDLYKLDITSALREELESPSIDIRYINDAAAFLQGEIFATGRHQEHCILGITLGTGLGSAIWQQGDKAYDANLWNTPYKDSIFEEYLVTRWFTRRFEELSGLQEFGLKEIIEKHHQTDFFQSIMVEYRSNLYQFLTFFSDKHLCNNYIIGGNIAKAWGIINNDNSFVDFNIRIGEYEEKAALIGAASLFE